MATQIEAYITGTVLKVRKNVGDLVSEGDIVLVLESMKMEMPLEAPGSGRVCAIEVVEGQRVSEGDVVLVLD